MSPEVCPRLEKIADTWQGAPGCAHGTLFRLAELERLAREAHADALAEEARSLSERAAGSRFYVACVGQFKRGKSTLLNALVGRDLLPTGVVPVTSVPTVLRHGDLAARIRRGGAERSAPGSAATGGDWSDVDPARLADFVTEEGNPGNAKGVLAVEVFAPSPLLASGLCFVDTPGLGSVFEASSAATRELVPQIDAALVVLGADPPLSGEELALIEEIARDVDQFVFVLNKADRVCEREATEAAVFARRVLSERLRRSVDRLFVVSATERLASGRGTRDWDALVARLQELVEQSGGTLVEGAVRRGVARLGARLRFALTEEAAALQRPLARSEERLQALQAAAGDMERALQDLGPLFSAEERRIGATFAARRVAFLEAVLPEAKAALAAALRADRKHHGPGLRRWAFQEAGRIARERVEPWLVEAERAADEAYRSAAMRFADEVEALLAGARSSDAGGGTAPLPALPREEALPARRQFTFYDFPHVASPAGLVSLVRRVADLLLPRESVRRRVERDSQDYLRRLLETNAARVENDLKQRLEESRAQLESQIRSQLAEAREMAERAMERARQVQADGTKAVRAALARLESIQTRLAALLTEGAPRPGR